ncbi:ferredoxin family protein [Candidatus Acidulodesulfobacterium sp. H_13]|uniref:4Fe-4S dicluster domain-containing protein n=1 Tax=Candidatus Acidulodesulfobacterium sp. H_13 TaxID=3395470 RepID=UPI003AF9D0E3
MPEKNNKNLNDDAAIVAPVNFNACDGGEIEIKTNNGLTMKKTSGKGKRGDTTINIIVNYCKGCELCVAFCPEHILEMDKEIVKVIDISKCTKCNMCEYLCPDFSISVE